MMPDVAVPWAFIGLAAGLWKLVLIVATIVILYGRTGLPSHPLLRLLRPWSSTLKPARVRPAPASAARSRFNDRLFVFLLVIAATAVAAAVATRVAVTVSAGSAP